MASTGRVGLARTPGWRNRFLIGYFMVSAVAVFGLWARYFLDGTAAASLVQPVDETGTLLGRTFGALMAGLVLLIAVAGLRTGRYRAQSLGLLGAGMVGYAALNTLGETLAVGSAESALLVLVLIASLSTGGSSEDQRHLVVLSGLLACSAIWLAGRTALSAGGSLTAVVTVTSWPGPHYVAEAAMALGTVSGLFAWAGGRSWGARLALIGLGAYCYSTLNAMDWAYVNDRTVLPVLAVTLGAAIAGAFHLMTKEEISHANPHRFVGSGGVLDGGGRHPLRRQG